MLQKAQPQAAPVNIHITTPQQTPQQPYQGYVPPVQVPFPLMHQTSSFDTQLDM